LGESASALKTLEPFVVGSKEPSTVDLFNFAMAKWGADGFPTSTLFARIVAREHTLDAMPAIANHLQCFAVARWAVGDTDDAIRLTNRARNAAILTRGEQTSCWRYMNVSVETFVEDLGQFLALINGAATFPAFFRGAQNSLRPQSA
jgi:hypothetical protein